MAQCDRYHSLAVLASAVILAGVLFPLSYELAWADSSISCEAVKSCTERKTDELMDQNKDLAHRVSSLEQASTERKTGELVDQNKDLARRVSNLEHASTERKTGELVEENKDLARRVANLEKAPTERKTSELVEENKDLARRITDLEKTLSEANARLEKLNERIAEIKNGSDVYLNRQWKETSPTCPAGTYMIGAVWEKDPSGPKGYFSSFAPVCRTLGR